MSNSVRDEILRNQVEYYQRIKDEYLRNKVKTGFRETKYEIIDDEEITLVETKSTSKAREFESKKPEAYSTSDSNFEQNIHKIRKKILRYFT